MGFLGGNTTLTVRGSHFLRRFYGKSGTPKNENRNSEKEKTGTPKINC